MIWNNQDPNQIREFLESDYKKIDERIVMQYSFIGWLENFKKQKYMNLKNTYNK